MPLWDWGGLPVLGSGLGSGTGVQFVAATSAVAGSPLRMQRATCKPAARCVAICAQGTSNPASNISQPSCFRNDVHDMLSGMICKHMLSPLSPGF